MRGLAMDRAVNGAHSDASLGRDRQQWAGAHSGSASSSSRMARWYGETPANFVPFNGADNWLHFVLAVGMIVLGILLGRSVAASTSSTATRP